MFHVCSPAGPSLRRSALAGLCLLALAGTVEAQEGSRTAEQPQPRGSAREEPRRNRVAGYVGALFDEDDQTGVTLGAEYEWRFHAWYGIGAYADFVTGSNRSLLLGPALSLHPVGGLAVILAPSAERANDDWYFAFRLGLEYEVEVRERWVLAPTVALDFARGERILLAGLSLGWLF